MASRSLNKVILIGNLTRDPELRYTPSGTAVCTFGLATNRSWTTQSGEVKEDTEFHRVVAWNKLGELCSQLLTKGRKIYVEGRLSTRTWSAQDGTQRTTTEIVIEDMIILDSRKQGVGQTPEGNEPSPPSEPGVVSATKVAQASTEESEERKVPTKKKEEPSEDINPDDIPF